MASRQKSRRLTPPKREYSKTVKAKQPMREESKYQNVPFELRPERKYSSRISISSHDTLSVDDMRKQMAIQRHSSRGLGWTGEKPTLLKDVLGAQLNDLDDFEIPIFKKKREEVVCIREAVQKNFFFTGIDDINLKALILAFEPIQVVKGDVIITQGETGDYFYVIGEGNVTYEVNSEAVGEGEAGTSFGELALLYSCPRAATVVAAANPTKLFRVDSRTFQAILQKQTQQSEEEKARLLKSVKFLEDIVSWDMKHLGRTMKPKVFEEGDCLMKQGDPCDAFFVLQDGEVVAKSEDNGKSTAIKAGDSFGEGALAPFPESCDKTFVAKSKVMSWSIDRETFQEVFGNFSSLVMRGKIRRCLEGVEMISDAAKVSGTTYDELTRLVTEERYSAQKTIFRKKKYTEAALYFVHEGVVELTGSKDKVVKAGEFFGEDQLLLDVRKNKNPSPTSPSSVLAEYTATATEDCVIGVLTLSDCRTVLDTTTLVDVESVKMFLQPDMDDDDDDALAAAAMMPTSMDRMTTQEWLQESSIEGLRESAKKNVELDDLERHSPLGEGQYGDVWLVSAKIGSFGVQHFALKIQKKYDPNRGESEDAIKRETFILGQMDHPHIVQMVHSYEDTDKLYILMGLVPGGELFDVIHQQGDDGLWYSGMPEDSAKFYSMVITDTLNYVHRKQYCFRDLKPENVLIDDTGYPVICDFGFAKKLPDNTKTYTCCGTPNYLAPEVIMNRGHNCAADHWSLGVLIYEMIAGENPFFYEDMDQVTLFRTIVEEKYYPLPDDVSDDAYELIDHLLEKDPVHRMGSLAGGGKDILNSKWLSTLDLVKVRQKRVKAPHIPKQVTDLSTVLESSGIGGSLLDD